MSQEINLKITGLNTNPSPLDAKEGSLGIANNVNIDQPNTATSRRGNTKYGTQIASVDADFQEFFNFQNTVIALEDGKLFKDSDGAGTWLEIGNTTETCTITMGSPNASTSIGNTDDLIVGMSVTSAFGIPADTVIIAITGIATFVMSNNATINDVRPVTFGSNINYLKPIDDRIGVRSVELNGSKFFTSDTGLYKLDSINSFLAEAGVPRAINATASLNGGAGWFLPGNQVAYRVLWGYLDGNKVLNYGAPSERIEITNYGGDIESTTVSGSPLVTMGSTIPLIPGLAVVGTGIPPATTILTVDSDIQITLSANATANGTVTLSYGDTETVDLDVYIPNDINTTHFFQIYRSALSGGVDIVANDEMQLAYEANPTNTDVTNGFVATFTDDTPDSLKGATIYTADSQEGILQANDEPPLANDVCIFQNHAFYANTKTRHQFQMTYLGGIVDLDEITIAGQVYTAVAGVPASNDEFQIGTGTVSEEIATTAKNLVLSINTLSTNEEVAAYYISGFDDPPGAILVEANDLTDNSFDIISADAGDQFTPPITDGVTSDNEEKPARVYISKQSQVDSVPILNYFDLGGQDSAILRIIPLREGIFAFKDNGQIYRIYGEGGGVDKFSANLFESTANLIAPRTAYVFNNQIFALTDQGVVSVSDAGVPVMSFGIEQQIQEISSDDRVGFDAYAFSYESDRQYILVTTSGSFVFNSFTKSWTTWDINYATGFVNQTDDKIYWGNDANGYVHQERKDNDKFDYADEDFDLNIFFSGEDNGRWIVEVDTVADAQVGYTLRQNGRYAVITEVDVDQTILFLDRRQNWENSAAGIYTPINCEVEWLPSYGDNPGYMKRFRQAMIFFRDLNSYYNLRFYNNFSQLPTAPNYIHVEFPDSYWGTGAWGNGAWGKQSSGSQQNRTYFPINLQRALWVGVNISTENAFTKFSLNGLSLMYEPQSTVFES